MREVDEEGGWGDGDGRRGRLGIFALVSNPNAVCATPFEISDSGPAFPIRNLPHLDRNLTSNNKLTSFHNNR
jgi:hypothetical protein